MCYTQSRFKALISACVMSLIATAGWSQSLTWLGTLPGCDGSSANGVSANGAVVVGYAYNAAGQKRAFRWTASGGMQDLGTPGGRESEAYAVSADGAVVVGVTYNAAGQKRAFRWTASGGMQDLGTLGGSYSVAWHVSADGAVVVGWAATAKASRDLNAFRWTASGGMQDIGTTRLWSKPLGVSADGSVVVGVASDSAFRWTASGGMEDLNETYRSLWPWNNRSWLWEARAISPNGRYIVGKGKNGATDRNEAFLLDTRFPRRGGM